MQRLLETFEVFASISFCKCITLGKTQNANDSLHNMIWHNAPKFKRVGQESLKACTALAILSFNDGSTSFEAVLNSLGISPRYKSMTFLTRRDHFRNLARIRRIRETHKRRRRQIASHTVQAEASRKRRDKCTVYASGEHGAEMDFDSEDSDTVCDECQFRTCPHPTKSKTDSRISCDGCDGNFHWRCVGQTSKKSIPGFYFCKNCNN